MHVLSPPRRRLAAGALGALMALSGALAGAPSPAHALTPTGEPTPFVGAKKYLVVGCAYADTRVSTLSQSDSRIGEMITGVEQYFRHVSNGRLSFTADYAGWATLPQTSATYAARRDWSSLDADCDNLTNGMAGRLGNTAADYDGFIELYSADTDSLHKGDGNYVGLPNQTGWSAGLGNKPRVGLRFDGGIAGGWVSMAPWVHELGHSFGLQHSHDVTSAGTDYNNPYDVMSDLGASTTTTPFGGVSVCNDSDTSSPVYQCVRTLNGTVPQDLAMFQKELLGWLDPQTEVARQTYGANAYQITAPQYDPSGALPNIRLVKVQANTTDATHYYAIEYKRTSHGSDSDRDALRNNWSMYDAGLTAAGDRVLVYDVHAPAVGDVSSKGSATLVARLTAGQNWESPNGRLTVWDNRAVNGLYMATSVSIGVSDRVAPTINAVNRMDYPLHTVAYARYDCEDQPYGAGIESCSATLANGAALDTNTVGEHDYTVTALDRAGNSTTQVIHYNVTADVVRPTITIAAPTAGGRYLQNADVRVSFSCRDAGSGVESCTGTVADGASIDTKTAGAHTFTVTARDRTGNTATQTVGYTVDQDTTRPAIMIKAPTARSYAQGAKVTARFACNDEAGGSGVASCTGTAANGTALKTRKPGTHTFAVTARDRAGNVRTTRVKYKVVRN